MGGKEQDRVGLRFPTRWTRGEEGGGRTRETNRQTERKTESREIKRERKRERKRESATATVQTEGIKVSKSKDGWAAAHLDEPGESDELREPEKAEGRVSTASVSGPSPCLVSVPKLLRRKVLLQTMHNLLSPVPAEAQVRVRLPSEPVRIAEVEWYFESIVNDKDCQNHREGMQVLSAVHKIRRGGSGKGRGVGRTREKRRRGCSRTNGSKR